MGMVALEQAIASAYVIVFGVHGAITRQAQERGVSRQQVYREHACVVTALAGTAWQQEKEERQRRIQELEERHAALAKRLSQAVVVDKEKAERIRQCRPGGGSQFADVSDLAGGVVGQARPEGVDL